MGQTSLAVKYRPQVFEDVVEQGSIKIILQQQIANSTFQHAYLFCGPSGDGKTTLARIFAKSINKGKGNPIEVDAASHSSVNDVRELSQQAKLSSLDSEYKILIVDECFPSNTLISTDKGDVPISEVSIGDFVYGMTGNNRVTHVYKNRVLTKRLCCVTINNRKIITTSDHLFFTNNGWVMAKNLKRGDVVYGDKDLQKLWPEFHQKSGQGYSVLFQSVRDDLSLCSSNTRTETKSSEDYNELSCLWKTIHNKGNRGWQAKDLLKSVREGFSGESIFSVDEYRIRTGIQETVIRKNESSQSDGKRRNSKCYDCNEREERYAAPVDGESGWKREVHNSTDSLIRSIRRWMGSGVSDSNKTVGQRENEVTYLLQSRPGLSVNETCSRGGWQRAQIEKSIIERCKEDELFETLRVESVEIYKSGCNEELFRDSFTDTELSQEFVTMYDLEVEDDHSYFANGILVHNCHSVSPTGWQAFLKLIEEPPAKTIFIFCTTDPQKIPKTILGRVQRFDFQRISVDGIFNRLAVVIEKENKEGAGIRYDTDALEYISKLADGGMRDALTTLDKVIAYSSEVTMDNVVKSLGVVDYKVMFDLLDSLVYFNTVDCVSIVEDLYRKGLDLKQFIKLFTRFVLDVNKYTILKSFKHLDIPETKEYRQSLGSYTESYESNMVRNVLEMLVKLNSQIKWETSPKAVIEAVFIMFCGKECR